MYRIIILATVIAVQLASAPIGPARDLPPCGWPSVLGVLVNGEVNGAIVPMVASTIDFYLVNSEAPSGTIGGFEFSWRLEPDQGSDLIVTSATLPPFSLNLGTNYDFFVGLGQPYLAGSQTRLVRLTVLALANLGPRIIKVGPASQPSLPGYADYNDGYDFGLVLGMTAISGAYDLPVATVNNPEIITVCEGVATDSASWSAIKALYT